MMSLLRDTTLLGILSRKLSPNVCNPDPMKSNREIVIFDTYFDIIYAAILKFDIPVVRTGLLVIGERFLDICKMVPKPSFNHRLSFSFMLNDKIIHTARVAGNVKYQDALLETVSSASWFFQQYYVSFKDAPEIPDVFSRFLFSLLEIYKIAIDNGFKVIASQIQFELSTFSGLIKDRDDLKAILLDVIDDFPSI
ncbi:MAG: hypothetical protein ACP5NN_10605 [Methanolinea sp.]